MPTRIGRSSSAERELKSLTRRPRLETTVSMMNLRVLKDRYATADIFPKVRVDLVRTQDRKNEERNDLAQSVAQKMATTLMKTYKGDRQLSKLVLRVNITVVSDGGCARSAKISNLFGKGAGKVKLTISYCLFCRESGRVAVSKQLSRSQETNCSGENENCSKAALLRLGADLTNEISKEVTFACCSRLPQWNQVSKRLIAVEKDGGN